MFFLWKGENAVHLTSAPCWMTILHQTTSTAGEVPRWRQDSVVSSATSSTEQWLYSYYASPILDRGQPHCPKNNHNFCIKTKPCPGLGCPITAGADATVYVWILSTTSVVSAPTVCKMVGFYAEIQIIFWTISGNRKRGRGRTWPQICRVLFCRWPHRSPIWVAQDAEQ